MKKHFKDLLAESIEIWFREDIGDGDHTTLATIPEDTTGKARLVSKDHGIIAGISIAEHVYHRFDPDLKMNCLIPDGSEIHPGNIVFEITGRVRSILQMERLVLNILQRMSGIATQTSEYMKLIEGLPTKILDTRKTTPGFRYIEKEAVRLGGAENHRVGLFDMILIKDNHIDFAGGIEQAIRQSKKYLEKTGKTLKIEIEARNMSDVERIMKEGGIDIILLDNFTLEQTRTAVNFINHRVQTESSGKITRENIREYASCGVDFISVGALTHQIKSLDLSLKAIY